MRMNGRCPPESLPGRSGSAAPRTLPSQPSEPIHLTAREYVQLDAYARLLWPDQGTVDSSRFAVCHQMPERPRTPPRPGYLLPQQDATYFQVTRSPTESQYEHNTRPMEHPICINIIMYFFFIVVFDLRPKNSMRYVSCENAQD